jgi:aspartyl-tRNA(Asn)/glutamyl-tRNA(Gln) amidotransferase subunit C
MLEIKNIEHLAKLARIELTDNEKQSYLKDISVILDYVDQIKEVVEQKQVSLKPGSVSSIRNVFRTDEVLNTPNSNTENIVAEFPEKEGGRLKVKKILAN